MNKNLGMAVVVAGLAFGGFVSNASASIVADGDFSNPWGGAFATYSGGSSFGPWSVSGDSVDLIGNYWQSPTVGGGSVDMDGNGPGAISQALTLNGNYLLTFSLSENPDHGPSVRGVRVTVGDALHDFFFTGSNSQTHNDMQYLTQSLAFNANGATQLRFESLSETGPYGAVIGGVSISAVPLPGAVKMFALGLLGLFGFHMFNRQRKSA